MIDRLVFRVQLFIDRSIVRQNKQIDKRHVNQLPFKILILGDAGELFEQLDFNYFIIRLERLYA